MSNKKNKDSNNKIKEIIDEIDRKFSSAELCGIVDLYVQASVIAHGSKPSCTNMINLNRIGNKIQGLVHSGFNYGMWDRERGL